MKKLAALAVLLMLAFVGNANALPYTDAFFGTVTFNEANPTYTWTFDLDNDALLEGDINADDIICSALVAVYFEADEAGEPFEESEQATLELDATLAYSGEIDTGLFLADVLAYVSADHVLTVKITRTGGDFDVTLVAVTGEYNCHEEPVVPEPATLGLIGLGLTGLGIVRRRRAARA